MSRTTTIIITAVIFMFGAIDLYIYAVLIGMDSLFWAYIFNLAVFVLLIYKFFLHMEKNEKDHSDVLNYIREHHPKEYKELKIEISGSEFDSVLLSRVSRDSKYLPHDLYLDRMYRTLKKERNLLIFFTVLIVIYLFLARTVTSEFFSLAIKGMRQ